jgi:hypothetical protein
MIQVRDEAPGPLVETLGHFLFKRAPCMVMTDIPSDAYYPLAQLVAGDIASLLCVCVCVCVCFCVLV